MKDTADFALAISDFLQGNLTEESFSWWAIKEGFLQPSEVPAFIDGMEKVRANRSH